MEIVVPVDEFARQMAAASAMYLRTRPNGVLRAPLTVVTAGQLVKAMVSDTLSRKLSWVNYSDIEITDAFKSAVPLYDMEGTGRKHREFFTDVVQAIDDQIEQFMSEAIGRDTWRIWSLRPIAVDYMRHTEDTPAIIETDAVIVGAYDGSGGTECRLLRRGEPLLDNQGKPLLKHRKGDLVLNPFTKSPMTNESSELCLDMILERGEDFRVYEWERMLRDNVVNYSHFSADDYELQKQEELKEEFYERVHTPTDRSVLQAQLAMIDQLKKLGRNGATRNVTGHGVPKRKDDTVRFMVYNHNERRRYGPR